MGLIFQTLQLDPQAIAFAETTFWKEIWWQFSISLKADSWLDLFGDVEFCRKTAPIGG